MDIKVRSFSKYDGRITFNVEKFINHNAYINSFTEEIGNDSIYTVFLEEMDLKDYIFISAESIKDLNLEDIKINGIIKIDGEDFLCKVIFDGYMSLEVVNKKYEYNKIKKYEDTKYQEWLSQTDVNSLPF